MTTLAPPQRVAFVSLGCAKNLVDSEVMIGKLGGAGWELVAEADEADAVVINTCAFIDAAKAESTDTILQHAARKKPGQQLIVAGCLSQRFGEELRSLVPEIDGVVGTGAYASIVEVLEEARAGNGPVRLELQAEPEHDFLPRLVTTPRATAYLKIAEGCDHPCTFCIIPKLRGAFRSRSMESIVLEARALAAAGTRELILIAQDTSMYGRDRGSKRGGLAELLHALHPIAGIEWIRLLYLYPATIDAELIDAMATLPKVCTYMDMPLQHAHPEMLRAMLRPSNGERYLEIVAAFRERVPGVTMRSTFIVGFPGETDAHVEYLEAWIERAELDRVGFFAYSREDGTPGATLPNQVPAKTKRARLLRLRDAQRRASERARARRVGRIERVLVEELRPLRRSDPLRGALGASQAWVGRSMGEAPGVDGGVYFTGVAEPGTFVDVRLCGATAFDFHGELARVIGRGLATKLWLALGLLVGVALGTVATQAIVERRSPTDVIAGYGLPFVSSPQAYFHKDRVALLLLGIDYSYDAKDQEYSASARSDTIKAVALNLPTVAQPAGSISLLSVPRDMEYVYPNGHVDKINSAYGTGHDSTSSARASERAVAKFLGLSGFDRYVTLRIDATKDVVDAIGGIDVVPDETMNYDDSWGHLHIHFVGGRHYHMNGEQAVSYARFRHDACSDPCRIKRQDQVIRITIAKLKNDRFNDLVHVRQLIDVVRRNVYTDLTQQEILSLALAFQHVDLKAIRTDQVPYTSDRELACCGDVLLPDDVAKAKLVATAFEAPPPGAIPAAVVARIHVDVRNGSGVTGQGHRLAASLRKAGFVVDSVSNASRVGYVATEIRVHHAVLPLAGERIRAAIALPSATVEPDPSPASTASSDVTVIVGRDYVATAVDPAVPR